MNLQRMLSVQPDVLEVGLFILADEYGDWVEANRRIDLLALDNKGRLVVVELKRSDWDDSHMELQSRPIRRAGGQHDAGAGDRRPSDVSR